MMRTDFPGRGMAASDFHLYRETSRTAKPHPSFSLLLRQALAVDFARARNVWTGRRGQPLSLAEGCSK
jgi:hypothetical protein